MEYISVKQAADMWGVSIRRVQAFLKENRIEGAKRFNERAWMIPEDAKKPINPRKENCSKEDKCLFEDFDAILDATILPMPQSNPDAVLDLFDEDRLRLHLVGEIAYLRGDFEQVICCFERTKGDDAARLRACPLTIAAAISMGDYPLYTEIEIFLKNIIKADISTNMTMFAEMALNTAYVSTIAPNMVSDWLKDGYFNTVPPKVIPDVTYKRIKYFQCLGKFEVMLVAAQTALAFYKANKGITYADIYLRMMCAVACCSLRRIEDAENYLLEALRICLPHGFITPFAESMTAFSGLLEKCLKREFPEHYTAVTNQWRRTFANWISFHNRFTKENITSILSLRNFEIAVLAARKVPYAEIAKMFNISVGRLNNIMCEIYEELFITNKKDLSKFVL